jgi:hypothetical protein
MDYNAKIRREKIRTALEIAILIAAATVVFALVLFGLYKINMIRLPEALEKLLGTAETQPPDNTGGQSEQRIYAALSGTPTASDDYVLEYDVDTGSLLDLLRTAAPETAYYMEAKITQSYGDKTLTRQMKLSRDGEKYNAQIYEGSSSEPTSIVCDGERIRYTDHAAGGKLRSRFYPAGGDFTLEYQLGLPSLEYMLQNGGENLKVTLLRTESENLYCLECEYPDINQREIVYVSVKYNCIVSAEAYYGDEIVYSFVTTKFDAGAAFADSVFITGNN